jgi:hypothetical protein
MNTQRKPRPARVRDYHTIQLRLPDSEAAKASEYAQQDGRSLGNFVRVLVCRALAEYEKTKGVTA